jgi:hypothetical protein
MRKLLIWTAILTVVGIVAGPATAGGKGGSSIELVRMTTDGARLASSNPTFAEQVTFTVSTSRTPYPWVQNRCWQNGSLVYEEWHGFWTGYYRDPIFTLGPTPSWDGGSAECEGRLLRQSSGGNMQTLANTTYQVNG